MFTGIIKRVGKIKKIEDRNGRRYFTIEVRNFLKDVKVGASIATNGACLTVIAKKKNEFKAEVMPETLRVTNFRNAKIGDLVNLELGLKANERIDGHFVLGHVDGVGVIENILSQGKNKELIIKPPRELMEYLACKGSVALDGVSLTISGCGKKFFKVSLISHTVEVTNFSKLKKRDKINIEVDMMARYLENLLKK